ncbi:AMP-binding protein [Cupriavidus necator]|uniref:AMP-binding protein n=1 Tax=Cupriavidus necator TaxID=106590 RepID=UPI002351DCA1|nr:AMP-binding protein [Cupriavidus necator]
MSAYNEQALATAGGIQQLNAADLLCAQHDPNRIALRCCSQDGRSQTYYSGSLTDTGLTVFSEICAYYDHLHGSSYGELAEKSAQFANFLQRLGVEPGDRVAVLLPRTPHLIIALLGVLRLGAVYQPLFTAFGPKAVEHRIQGSEAVVVVTDKG